MFIDLYRVDNFNRLDETDYIAELESRERIDGSTTFQIRTELWREDPNHHLPLYEYFDELRRIERKLGTSAFNDRCEAWRDSRPNKSLVED